MIVIPVEMGARQQPPPLPTGSVEAEKVPDAAKPQKTPLVRIIMPVVMVAVMVGMVVLMVVVSDGPPNPLMLLFPLMMLASVAMMFNPAGGNDPDEVRRTYLRHLGAVRKQAVDNARAQRAHDTFRHPSPEHTAALVAGARLWERSAHDEDAGEVRIGVGPTNLITPVEVPETGATEDLDPVCAVSLRHTVQAVGTVEDVPLALQLRAFRYVAIRGEYAADLVRAIVLDLAIFHGPEAVGLLPGQGAWEWMKRLPHARSPQTAAFRVVVISTKENLAGTWLQDADVDCFIIVDTTSPNSAGEAYGDAVAGPITELVQRAEDEGLVLEAGAELCALTEAGRERLGIPDRVSAAHALSVARRLAPLRRPDVVEDATRGDLLSLLGFSDVADLRGAAMWPGREGAKRLAAPIGNDPTGRPVVIDIKESAQGGMGPHGLCIGATGSGKSEALRTMVVALAATHSPAELNFVLVDFKGGATFLGLEDLPHTSAVITNLEEESLLVERMHDALSGEMTRRQEFLRTAGNYANVSEYNADRGNRPPLPALVIVVDEFSELLGQHPDFADLFVAIGRLGRSLHVHLLLASQRLEEGRLRGLDSHLSYRIGLKTFSAAESRQVLGVADAYHLPSQPGSGFLKTDADALAKFQAFYVSGPLQRRVRSNNHEQSPQQIELFTGWEPQQAEPDIITEDTSSTLLSAVVEAARAEAAARGLAAHQVWLPPLPPRIELSAVAAGEGLRVGIGSIDKPYAQRQDPLLLNVSAAHAALCGGPQSGKSMGLKTIVSGLAVHNSPADVRFYIIDLGGGTLTDLETLPHVAAVARRSESEKVRRVVDEVAGLIEKPEPRHTFLVIDGWHNIGTSGAEYEDLAEACNAIAADGISARVHLIIATPRWTTLRPAIRDLITERIELRLGEAMDSLIDRKKQQKLPGAPGRGLTSAGEDMLLAYTAPQDIAYIATRWAEAEPAPRLKMLPARLNLSALRAPAVPHMLPWGVGGRDLEPQVWDTTTHFVCIGAGGAGKSTWVATLLAQLCTLPRAAARLVVVDMRRAHLGAVPEEMMAAYAATTSAAEEALRNTATTLRARLPGPDITPAQLKARDWWTGPDIYVVIDDADLLSDISLAPLVDLIPHARDIGLHLVVARKAGGIGRALFGQFFSSVRDSQPSVLVLDAPRDEGAMFGIKPSAQPPGRGTFLTRGEIVGLCQVAHISDEEEGVLQ